MRAPTKSKIDWCDYTWNPVTGCRRGCPYCYAKRQHERFFGDFTEIKFHPERFSRGPSQISTPSIFFIGSMSDPEYWKLDWWEEILDECRQNPDHIYFFLTKNPILYPVYHIRHLLPPFAFFGVSLPGFSAESHARKVKFLIDEFPGRFFISFEPLEQPIDSLSDIFKSVPFIIAGPRTKIGRVQNPVDEYFFNAAAAGRKTVLGNCHFKEGCRDFFPLFSRLPSRYMQPLRFLPIDQLKLILSKKES